jgi:hypothetical protein
MYMNIIRRMVNYGIAIALLGVLVFSVMTPMVEGMVFTGADFDKKKAKEERIRAKKERKERKERRIKAIKERLRKRKEEKRKRKEMRDAILEERARNANKGNGKGKGKGKRKR